MRHFDRFTGEPVETNELDDVEESPMREIPPAEFARDGGLDETNEILKPKGLMLYVKENGSFGVGKIVKPKRRPRKTRQEVDLGD